MFKPKDFLDLFELGEKTIPIWTVMLFIVVLGTTATSSYTAYYTVNNMNLLSESIQESNASSIKSNNDLTELIKHGVKKASTDASVELIKHALKDVETGAGIIAKFEWFGQFEWGAQIAAGKNVCIVYPERLENEVRLTSKERKILCRKVLSM